MARLITRYIILNTLIALAFISVVLAALVFLTQSLRFLELIIESGAGGSTFWIITLLALPRFLEIILPLALAGSVIFVYQRMSVDREITILRASGFSPASLAKPVVFIACALSIILWVITFWLAPVSLRTMQQMQHLLKSEFSNIAFQEEVFNRFGKDFTVFVRDRTSQGELKGLMIHDSRESNKNPVTVTAERGLIEITSQGFKVTVFQGSRQDYNPGTQTLNRLDFERYTIDLPVAAASAPRWREPDERTFAELLNPDPDTPRDMENIPEFRVEAHRRVISPLLALSLTFSVLPFLLLGPYQRQEKNRRILMAIGLVILVQALYLAAFNLAQQYEIAGLMAMYLAVGLPILTGMLILSPRAEHWRQKVLYLNRGIA